MSRDGFWDDPESAQKLMKEKKSIDDRLEELDKLGSQLEDLEVMVEMAEEENDEEMALSLIHILYTPRSVASTSPSWTALWQPMRRGSLYW